jgi:hypothetical protein
MGRGAAVGGGADYGTQGVAADGRDRVDPQRTAAEGSKAGLPTAGKARRSAHR